MDEVVFTGQVDDDELYAYYRLADVFLCLSEHEGFGVPLQEAMHFGLPVIAYDAGAVRETLRGGGLLLQDKRPELVAELLDRVTRGGELRRAVLASQATAIAGIRATDFGALLRETAEPGAGGRTAPAAGLCGTERSFGIPRRVHEVDGIPQVRIDQWVPALHRGDAIGDSARLMRDAFRSWGHEADVYALELDADLEGDGRAVRGVGAGRAARTSSILHFALPSPLTAAFRDHRGRRVLLHHNITPPEYFAGWDDDMARICRVGREELATLAGHCDLGLADSECNRRELEALGVARTGVLPICLDFARYREAPNPVLRRLLEDGRTNLLFVGRLAPNKKPEDLIRLASCWKRFVAPDVRLVLVGKLPRRRAYFDALQALAYEEGFTPEEVVFTGHVAHDELLACYAAARVFVSMSEHEGFGVPLVESMLTRVPVLAYSSTAVPFTLGRRRRAVHARSASRR